jgi:hypothetical protein
MSALVIPGAQSDLLNLAPLRRGIFCASPLGSPVRALRPDPTAGTPEGEQAIRASCGQRGRRRLFWDLKEHSDQFVNSDPEADEEGPSGYCQRDQD